MRTRRCLTRGIDDSKKKYLNSAAVARCTNMPTFEQFWIELEGEPITSDHRMHDGGHVAVGGDLSNFYSSPAGALTLLFECLSPRTRPHSFSSRPALYASSRQPRPYLVDVATDEAFSSLRNFRTIDYQAPISQYNWGPHVTDGQPWSLRPHLERHEHSR